MDEKLYTVREVAAHYRVSRQAVYDWINAGRLSAIKVGERVRISEAAMRSFERPMTPSAYPLVVA